LECRKKTIDLEFVVFFCATVPATLRRTRYVRPYTAVVIPTVHFIPQSPLGYPLAAVTVDNADVNVAVVIPLSSLPNTKEIGEVGYKFRKQFGSMGWFNGTVIEIIPKSYLRRCVYTEDGEFQDLRIEDLVQLAKLDKKSQNDCSVKGRQSPPTINHKASSSAKKKQCKIKSRKYSGISPSQREQVAMATLASYLEECGGMFQNFLESAYD